MTNGSFQILHFEDLIVETVKEMKKVTDFLGFNISQEEVTHRLGNGYTDFYRNHKANFSHFTSEQESYIHEMIETTVLHMKTHNLYNMFPRIIEYL